MDEETRDYFVEAARWDQDRAAALRRSARQSGWVAAGALVIAVLASAALAGLVPLKRVDPFVVRVDSATGSIDVVPAYAGTADLPETVTRHLVTQYVTQRERYVPAIAESDYDQIGAFHSAAMNQSWAAAWARGNPESPLNRYADGTHVRAEVQAVSFLKRERGTPDVVQVRFVAATQRGPGATEDLVRYVATLVVTFGPPSGDLRMRALNPLGFKVLEYRREPEVAGALAAGAAADRTGSGAVP